MKKSEMEFAIAMMLKDVNIYSRYAEKAKAKKSSYDRAGLCL